MNNNYTTKEILSAIDSLLDNKKIKDNDQKNKKENPLILKKEIKNSNESNKIPKNTESIIKQAENFLKK
tara:strand:- start:1015 stop:1221 length:207 start_codon:yes stop_codon:yes gene_type:complete